jgi:hypothetical protein
MSYCEIISVQAPEKTHGDHLVIKNISVVDSWSYPDCSYKERIKLQFTPCDKDGFINGMDVHSIVEVTLDMDTGYIPHETVGRSLKETLSGAFRIVKLDELIKAFKYRKYYCSI